LGVLLSIVGYFCFFGTAYETWSAIPKNTFMKTFIKVSPPEVFIKADFPLGLLFMLRQACFD